MPVMSPGRWQRIRSIFDRVLDAPSERRASILDEECRNDSLLREQVEALLAADGAPAQVFGSSFDELAKALAPEDTDLGRLVGPYRIQKRVGAGGMGVVYLAERADGEFAKQVALKLVKRGMDTEEILRRFRNERQILAGLQHPNIAQLSDGGMSDDGRPYLVMEYVDGTPIDEYCDARSMTVEGRLRLFEAVLEAVQYAHQNLIVHRDLKPSNILVTDDGTIKLLDFGIAKLLSTDEEALTRTEVRVLTPEYAAPEQKAGGHVTTAADIFGLGVVLCELLTGARPVRSPGTILGEPVRPSVALSANHSTSHEAGERGWPSAEDVASRRGTSVERLRKRLRGDLDTIVLKALHNDPDRRYTSAEAFLSDMRRHAAGQPVLAQPDTFVYRAGKFIRRHRFGVAASAAFVTLLIGFAIMSIVQQTATERERDRAALERDKAEEVAAFLSGLFDASDPFLSQSERLDTLRVRELLDRGAERVERELQDQPAVQAKMLDVVGNVYRSLGLYDRAIPLLATALERRSEILGANHGDVAESLQSLGQAYLATSEYGKAEESFRRAADIYIESEGPRTLNTSHALAGIGAALRLQSKYEQAENVLREALQIQHAERGDQHLDVASTLLELGRVYQDRGSPAVAESLYREVLDVHRSLLGDEHPKVAVSMDNLAIVLRQQTRLEDAEHFILEAMQIRERVLGPEHPQTLSSLYELASLARDRGNYREAVSLFERVIELDRKVLGARHHYVGLDLRELGITYARMGDYEAALDAYGSSLEILRAVLPKDHMDISVVINGIGYTYLQMGNAPRAEPLLREALRMRLASQGQTSWQTGVSKSVLGECLMKLGHIDEAQGLLEEGFVTLRRANGPTEAALRRLVTFYETVGRQEEADRYRELLEKAGG